MISKEEENAVLKRVIWLLLAANVMGLINLWYYGGAKWLNE
jgi:hypothetical protein